MGWVCCGRWSVVGRAWGVVEQWCVWIKKIEKWVQRKTPQTVKKTGINFEKGKGKPGRKHYVGFTFNGGNMGPPKRIGKV